MKKAKVNEGRGHDLRSGRCVKCHRAGGELKTGGCVGYKTAGEMIKVPGPTPHRTRKGRS
jgi:hypothetical protein